MVRTTPLVVTALLAAVLLIFSGSTHGKTVPATNTTTVTRACQPPHDTYTFCDTTQSLDTRVRDLISRLQDQEKPRLLTAREGANSNVSRLGVPEFDWGLNAIHGVQSSCVSDADGVHCPSSFPNPVNFGASFNTSMFQTLGAVIGTEMRALWVTGATEFSAGSGRPHIGLDCWSPNININRDPRWGRNMEVPSEDPYVNGQFGKWYTIGLQTGEDNRYLKNIVTLKHWDAYSLEDADGWSRHNFSANVSMQRLQDTYFPAFKASVQEGKAKGVMCSYNAVNGIPTCASAFLNDVLRNQWGFDGYVTSDSGAIKDINVNHHYVSSDEAAACVAIRDGRCDINSGTVYRDSLLQGVSDGLCSIADVDQALYNTLRVRFELGLFDPIEDQPYWHVPLSQVNTTESQALVRLATLESMVLLQNPNNVLPLKTGQSIAAIGPHSLAQTALVGNYLGQICSDDSLTCITTPFQALSAANIGGSTHYSLGCNISSNDTSQFAAAIALAKDSDVVVLYLGIDVTVEDESHDRVSIDLPYVQHQLAAAILALKKPTVIVLINGGMVAIEQELASSAAILSAGYPGVLGSAAIADTLFGNNPSLGGKLPYTLYPASYINEIKMSNMEMDTPPGRSYRFYTGTPLLPFGYGISLTTFTVENVTDLTHGLHLHSADKQDSPLSFKVTNTGSRYGDEVVFAYFSPTAVQGLESTTLIKQLYGYQRVHLAPGQSTTVTFPTSSVRLAMVEKSGDRVAAPGIYRLLFTNGVDQKVECTAHIHGEKVVLEHAPMWQPPAME